MAEFKNNVTIAGALTDIDGEIRQFTDKTTQEPYNAAIGSYDINIAKEDDPAEIVSLKFFYKETNRNGKANPQYSTVTKWLEGNQNPDGNPFLGLMVKINTSISANAFVSPNSGELIESTQIQGNFINTQRVGDARGEFFEDFLIQSAPVPEVKNDEETGRAKIAGHVFDFKNMAIPVEFILEHPDAIKFFEDLDAASDNPVLLEVWGKLVHSKTIIERSVPSAFGEDRIDISEIVRKENVITGANPEAKEITEDLYKIIKDGMTAYEVYLSDTESRSKDSSTAKKPSFGDGNTSAKPDTKKAAGGFKF